MDMSKYQDQKKNGTIKVVAIGPDTVAVFVTKFDTDTGKPSAGHEQFNLPQLDETVANVEAQLASLKEFRADVAATLSK